MKSKSLEEAKQINNNINGNGNCKIKDFAWAHQSKRYITKRQ